jgi:outer membrane protein
MKTLITITIIILNILNFEKLHANNEITYLDLDKVLAESLAGKSINKQIITIQKNNNKDLKDKEKKLFEKEKSIISKKNILQEKDFNEKVKAFQKEVSEYKKNRSALINEINQKKLNAISQLLDKLNPLLAKYSNEKSISLIVQKKNIIIGKSELDITADIMKILDTEIKKINIK